jgi:hypothetical protein
VQLFLARVQAVEAEQNKPGMIRWLYESARGSFSLLNVLYFGGSLTIIGAMTLFMTLAWGM